MKVRPITDADVDAVAEIHVRTWRVAYAGIVPDDVLDALDPAENARMRRARPVPAGAATIVADDGRVVGFAAAGPHRDGGGGELYAIYVDPDRWGNGAGRALFDGARDHLRAQGFTEMVLWVLEENHDSRRFYERMGMEWDGTRKHYTPRGSDARLPELRYATRL
jgi:ribosomal protein S18 acetylase RimI-like enzyme